jgi:anti-sigma B factor antagonist
VPTTILGSTYSGLAKTPSDHVGPCPAYSLRETLRTCASFHVDGSDAGVSLEVDVVRERPDLVIAVRGELDLATAPLLRDAFEGVDRDEGAIAVIDLTEVGFLDSSGLRVLAQCQRMLVGPDGGAALRLVVATDAVRRVLDVTGLHSFFSVYESVDDALRAT